MQQLEGLETLTGTFRVRLVETKDGTDWKLQTWVEESLRKPKFEGTISKLINAYLGSGRPKELLENALSKIEPLAQFLPLRGPFS